MSEEVDVELNIEEIAPLYGNGIGIKAIASKFDVDVGRIKRLLMKNDLYQGAEHTVLPRAERPVLPRKPKITVEPPQPFLAEEEPLVPAYSPVDMLTWSRGDTTSIEPWERGYLVDFQQTGWVRCPLPSTGKTVCWRVRARLLAPQLADLVLLLGDDDNVERLTPSLRSSLDPRCNVWTIRRAIGQGGYIEIRYRDDGASLATVFFSQLEFGEVK